MSKSGEDQTSAITAAGRCVADGLWDELCRAYDALVLAAAAGRDDVFRDLVLARIIEPTSKLDSLRVLSEAALPTHSAPKT